MTAPSHMTLWTAEKIGLKRRTSDEVRSGLTEGEGVRLDARLGEGDFEGAVGDRAALPDELVEPLVGGCAVALAVGVGSVGIVRWLPVDEHLESWGGSRCGRSHDEVKIARVEPVGNPPVGPVQRGGLFSHRPVPRQSPLVQSQLRRYGIDMALAGYRTTGRCEAFGAFIADIGLGRSQAYPIGCGLDAWGVDRDEVVADAGGSGLGQQLLNDHLRLLVFALTEVVMPDLPFPIGEVEGGPEVVCKGNPDCVVVVDRDGIGDSHVQHSPPDIVDIVLEPELGRMYADHDQPLVLIPLGPGAAVGECAEPVDAGVGPEVDQDDLASQACGGQWRRIEPRRSAV